MVSLDAFSRSPFTTGGGDTTARAEARLVAGVPRDGRGETVDRADAPPRIAAVGKEFPDGGGGVDDPEGILRVAAVGERTVVAGEAIPTRRDCPVVSCSYSLRE